MELTIYTDGSARDLEKGGVKKYCAGWGLWGYVDGDEKRQFNAHGPIMEDPTNNRGELRAATHALNIAITLNAKKVIMWLDSQYVREGALFNLDKWMKRGWKTRSGEQTKNIDLWKEFLIARGSCQRRGIELEYHWVKGHSDVKGNDLADEQALLGAFKTLEDQKDVFNLDYDNNLPTRKPKEEEIIVSSKKKVKAPDKDPFIVGSRVIMLSNQELYSHTHPTNGEVWNITYSSKYPNCPRVVDRECGVENADTLQCVTFHREQDFQIVELKEHIDQLKHREHVLPVVVYWDKLSSGPLRKEVFEKQGDFPYNKDAVNISYTGIKKDAKTKVDLPIEVPLARLATNPRRIWSGIEHLEVKFEKLMDYLSGEIKDENIIDVTDMFIEEKTDKKGKVKRSAIRFPGQDSVVIKAWGEEHTLTSMVDMPKIDGFSSLVKVHQDIQIKLIRHSIRSTYYRYSIVLESEGSVAIVDNPYTNVKYAKR